MPVCMFSIVKVGYVQGQNLEALTFLLQKELRNSDVGNLGRIVLPKVSGFIPSWLHFHPKQAVLEVIYDEQNASFHVSAQPSMQVFGNVLQKESEQHLPLLAMRGGINLQVEDFDSDVCWKFRYRWANAEIHH